jgi:hypothetical protein
MLAASRSFDLALQHPRVGRFAEAKQLYRHIPPAQPNHDSATHNNLGGVLADENHSREATQSASDHPRLARLRETLRPEPEAYLFMGGIGFARQIEAARRTMWRHWWTKEPRPS